MYGTPEAWVDTESGEYVHSDCMTEEDRRDLEANPDEWMPVSDYAETDSPNHCFNCGEVIDEVLTNYGEEYVVESILEAFMQYRERGYLNPVSGVLWPRAYGSDYDLEEKLGEKVLEILAGAPLDPHPAFRKYRLLLPEREVGRAGGDVRGTGGGTRGKAVPLSPITGQGHHPTRFDPEV